MGRLLGVVVGYADYTASSTRWAEGRSRAITRQRARPEAALPSAGKDTRMDFGAAIFFTDYSMGPVELGRALEERGFGSLWAPEHSHIPLSRRSPFPQGGDLPKKYYDVMDPFVTLAAAAAATSRLQVGTGI